MGAIFVMSTDDAKYYYNKGIIYNEEGKYGLAIDNFKTALSMDPDSMEINFNLGVAFMNKKEYPQAIECFKKVLTLSPDEVAGLSNLALAYARISDFNKAIDNYKRILELTPEDTPTYKDLGDVYTKNKQYDNAIECYKHFLKAHPTSFVVKDSLNTAINLKKNHGGFNDETQKDKELTSNNEEQSISVSEESALEYYELAINCVKEQKFDTAIENVRKCLKINSDYPNAYDLLNKLFKIKEKFSNNEHEKQNIKPILPENKIEKIETQKSAVFVDYRKFNELYTLGIAYYNAQNYSMALENFQKGSEINPNDKACNDYISEITSKMNNL